MTQQPSPFQVIWDKKLIKFFRLKNWLEAGDGLDIKVKGSQKLSFHGTKACVIKREKERGRMKKRKTERETRNKNQLGHWIWGGEKS